MKFGIILNNEFKKFFNLKTILAAIISAAVVFMVFVIVIFSANSSQDEYREATYDEAKAYYEEQIAKYEDYIADKEEYAKNTDLDEQEKIKLELDCKEDQLYIDYYKLIIEEEMFEGVLVPADPKNEMTYSQDPFSSSPGNFTQIGYLSTGTLGVFFIGIVICVLGLYTVGKEKLSGNIKCLYTSPVRRSHIIAAKLLVTAVLAVIAITLYFLLEMCVVGSVRGPDKLIVYDKVGGDIVWRATSVYAFLLTQYAVALPQILLAGALGVLLGVLFDNGIGSGIVGAGIIIAFFITVVTCGMIVHDFSMEWLPFGTYGFNYDMLYLNLDRPAILILSGLLYTSVVAAAGIVTAERMQIKKG